jgi:regulator of cell morphogenesis and NO signaling
MTDQPRFTRETTLAEATRLRPEAVAIFEEMEIDYSCQGPRSLADAAHDAGYRVEELIERLESARRSARPTDWFEEPLPALIDYLTSDHRSTLDEHLPALRRRIEEAIAAVGEIVELRRMRAIFRYLSTGLESHVINEEHELFPFINKLHAATGVNGGPPKLRIGQRVLRELVEHETFRDRLRTLKELAQRLPANTAVNALRNDLSAFSEEVNRHMHLENNVLYPRAIEIENGLRRPAAATA